MAPASGIAIRGLAFEHTNYTWPQAGYSSFQSEAYLDGAIVLRNANRVTLSGIRVAHTGAQTWGQWRARGMDEGTIVADPLLKGIELAPAP